MEDCALTVKDAIRQLKGHNVTIATTFDEAVEQLEKNKFDVLLTKLPVCKNHNESISECECYGFPLAWIAISKGIKLVAVLSSDMKHDYQMSYAMDYLKEPIEIGDVRVIFSSDCFRTDGKKEWVGYLKKLTQ